MTQTISPTARKGHFRAVVLYQRQQEPRIYRLGLSFSGIAGKAFGQGVPGQFAELDVQETALPSRTDIPPVLQGKAHRHVLLRRPFSFSRIESRGRDTLVEVVYAVLGPGTLRLTTLKAGDSLSVIGPLGRGFSLEPQTKHALLIAGGLGAPPIEHLARLLVTTYPQVQTVAFCGARTKEDIPFDIHSVPGGTRVILEELEELGIEYHLTTDDGSAGTQGFVTEQLKQWLQHHPGLTHVQFFACGPQPMLAHVAQIAGQMQWPCQVSLERNMACGFNLCQGCAVECYGERNDETVYKMCCQDGPVFDAQEVVWARNKKN